MISSGANPSLCTADDISPYDLAKHNNYLDVCNLLLESSSSNFIPHTNQAFDSPIDEGYDSQEKFSHYQNTWDPQSASEAVSFVMQPPSQDVLEERSRQLHLLDHGLLSFQDPAILLPNSYSEVTDDAHKENYWDPSLPVEEFVFEGNSWFVYVTEEGYYYYLDGQTHHSQWFDPRIEGIVSTEPEGELFENVIAHNPTEEPDMSQVNIIEEKKFTQPRQLKSPLKVPKKQIPTTPPAGKMAWVESDRENDQDEEDISELSPQRRTVVPDVNCFSPDGSSALRAKSLRKNVPFPLTSPPLSLRLAALKIQDTNSIASPSRLESKRDLNSSPKLVRPWSSPARSSPQPKSASVNSGEVENQNRTFVFSEGAYGCGGNVFAI